MLSFVTVLSFHRDAAIAQNTERRQMHTRIQIVGLGVGGQAWLGQGEFLSGVAKRGGVGAQYKTQRRNTYSVLVDIRKTSTKSYFI